MKFMATMKEKKTIALKFTDTDADLFRDLAIENELERPELALKLMELAGKIRPKGPFIKNKTLQFKNDVAKTLDIEGDCSYILDEEQRIKYYLSNDVVKIKSKINTPSKYTVDKPFIFKKDIYENDNAYYLQDLRQITKPFPDSVSLPVQCGDALRKRDESIFIKARKINDKRSILLKLNNKRHWKDYKHVIEYDRPWSDKVDDVVWRGGNTGFSSGQVRLEFVKKYFNTFNIGFSEIINNLSKNNLDKVTYDSICEKYVVGKLSMQEQLKYKFIVSLEGNDVSTGLKWIMNSNSVPIMKKPSVETWMMEGLLEPFVHYLPLNDDMSNLPDLINWGKNNPNECMKIARNGQVFMSQFNNEEREMNLQRMIIMNYFISLYSEA